MTEAQTFTPALLSWYKAHQRAFPWRDNPEPYAVWVSEIMAQQTRLETVLDYYHRWMARFPDIANLATASQQEVLNQWEGLGYYSRARNLHKAAKIVMEEYDGKLPTDAETLQKLPGIGRYTAGAIASIAFGQDAAVVDGNVKRLLARLFNINTPVNTGAGEKAIWQLAEAHLPTGQAASYNQALMDLGATICLPRTPACKGCPLATYCQSFKLGLQGERPVKKPKAKIPHYTVTAAVITQDDWVLIAQRPEKAMLGGMWEFPGGKREGKETLESCLKRELLEELGVTISVNEKLGIFRHAYTHFSITLHAFNAAISTGTLQNLYHQEHRRVKVSELDDYPMGKIDRQIALLLQDERPDGP